jgi:hypothetical protein
VRNGVETMQERARDRARVESSKLPMWGKTEITGGDFSRLHHRIKILGAVNVARFDWLTKECWAGGEDARVATVHRKLAKAHLGKQEAMDTCASSGKPYSLLFMESNSILHTNDIH